MEIGKHAAFQNLVHSYAADLHRFAYWLCRDHSVAEDLVQETYLRAWAYWRELRDPHAVKGWLLTILHHEYMRALHKKPVELKDASELEPRSKTPLNCGKPCGACP
jgi:RNA polymerase sigma-70 factor, ECF subfamily